MEVALLAPVFGLLLLLLSFWAQIALQKLALIQLSRDSVLMLARNGELWGQSVAQQQASVRSLAARQTLLDPKRLQLSYETVTPLGLDRIEGLQGALNSDAAGLVQGWIGLRRYRLAYAIPLGGLSARLLPRGLRLEESLVVLGDPWKMQASRLIERIL